MCICYTDTMFTKYYIFCVLTFQFFSIGIVEYCWSLNLEPCHYNILAKQCYKWRKYNKMRSRFIISLLLYYFSTIFFCRFGDSTVRRLALSEWVRTVKVTRWIASRWKLIRPRNRRCQPYSNHRSPCWVGAFPQKNPEWTTIKVETMLTIETKKRLDNEGLFFTIIFSMLLMLCYCKYVCV